MQDLSKEVALNPLALIGTRGTEKMLKRIEKYIGEWRKEENPDLDAIRRLAYELANTLKDICQIL